MSHKGVTIPPSALATGDWLVELVRAHMHTANGSAMLRRIAQGVERYIAETPDARERALAEWIVHDLEKLEERALRDEDADF